MSDPMFALFWLCILVVGVGGSMLAHAAGLDATYVRDLLHIGAGVWVFGWPWWQSPTLPTLIVAAAAIGTALVPYMARHNRWFAHFRGSVTTSDERFGGLIWYTATYAIMTAIGLRHAVFPAAVALLALSFGDGFGGMVGRRFGRHFFKSPGAKCKSLEGSLTVFALSSVGAWVAAWVLEVDIHPLLAFGLGACSAVTEAVAPGGSDNVLVPTTVFLVARQFS